MIHPLVKIVFPHFITKKRSVVQVSVGNYKNLSYICTKNHQKMIDLPKFFKYFE
jgi:hypothetical protein